MPSVLLQPSKPKLSNLQAFLKQIETKNNNKGKELKKGWKTEILTILNNYVLNKHIYI